MISFSRILGSATVLLSLFATGCHGPLTGSGRPGSEVREVQAFTGVEVRDALEAVITVAPGEPRSVTVSGDEDLIGMVRTRVEGDTLVLEMDQGGGRSIETSLPIVVTISSPGLDHFAASGASEMTAGGVDAEEVTLSVSGASRVVLAGRARALRAGATKGSEIVADELVAEGVDIVVDGASDAIVCATESLDAKASGASSVGYACDPDEVTQQVEDASSVGPR